MIVTVNGSEVDVINSSINPTFQSNNLNEIKNRNLSNTRLRFPKTPRNMEVFNYLGAQGDTSTVPYDIVPCQITEGGITQLKGALKVTSFKDDIIEGIVKQESGDIFDLIKDKDLKDLDFSAENHYLNVTTYDAAIGNTDGYVYPLANYGKPFDGVVDVANQSPHLYKHFIWDKIFTEAGVDYVGDIFDNSDFKSEVISMSTGNLDTGKAFKQGLEQGESETFTTSALTYDLDTTFLPLESADYYADDRLKIHEDGRIEVLEKCKILLVNTFKSRLSQSTFSTPAGSLTSTFDIKKNGVSVYTHTDTEALTGTAPTWVALIEHTATHYSTAEAGDIYTFETTSSGVSNITATSANINLSNTYKDSYLNIIESYIDFNDLIGDMSQTAFIKDVIASNGLMFKSYHLRGKNITYQFSTMESILNDRDSAEDWSDKKSNTVSSALSVGSYGLNNRLNYKYEKDITPFLDYNHISTNLNQKESNSIYKSPYEVSRSSGAFLNVDTINPIMSELVEDKRFEDDGGGQEYLAAYNAYYKAIKVPNKAAKVKLHQKTFSIEDGNGAAPTEVTKLVHYLTNDRVEMDFYYNRFFKAFSRIIDEPRKDKMNIYLSPLDIHNLDFFKLKYFAEDGKYYYLNKVTKFKEGINTLCELIAVKGFESNQYECEDYIHNNYVTNTYTT